MELSRGALPQQAVDALVLQVNGGAAPADEAAAGWRERIVAGRFDGTTVVVTGAASGIGRATASRIVREGGRVIAADVTAAGLEQVASDLDTARIDTAHVDTARVDTAALVPVTADITTTVGVERIVAAAGPVIDGLANVAGVVDDFSPAHETSDEMWRRVFAVNVDGVFALTRAR